MAVTAQANILNAIVLRLRTFTEITTLTSVDRIGAKIGEDWFPGPTAQPAIWLRRSGAPVDPDAWLVGVQNQRLDLWCYGASGLAAAGLMNLALAALCPAQGTVNRGSFKQALTGGTSVIVYNIVPETGVIDGTDPETGYAYSWCPLMVQFQAVAV